MSRCARWIAGLMAASMASLAGGAAADGSDYVIRVTNGTAWQLDNVDVLLFDVSFSCDTVVFSPDGSVATSQVAYLGFTLLPDAEGAFADYPLQVPLGTQIEVAIGVGELSDGAGAGTGDYPTVACNDGIPPPELGAPVLIELPLVDAWPLYAFRAVITDGTSAIPAGEVLLGTLVVESRALESWSWGMVHRAWLGSLSSSSFDLELDMRPPSYAYESGIAISNDLPGAPCPPSCDPVDAFELHVHSDSSTGFGVATILLEDVHGTIFSDDSLPDAVDLAQVETNQFAIQSWCDDGGELVECWSYGTVTHLATRQDVDGDGLPGDEEVALATDPLDPDSDDDGFLDGIEVAAGTDPNDPNSFPNIAIPSLRGLGLLALITLLGATALLHVPHRSPARSVR